MLKTSTSSLADLPASHQPHHHPTTMASSAKIDTAEADQMRTLYTPVGAPSANSSSQSMFEGVSMAPPDPILGVTENFKADTSSAKLNLGVGAYRTEELQPYVLQVVKKVLSCHLSIHACAVCTLQILPLADVHANF